MAKVNALATEAEAKPRLTLAEVAGGERVLQLYEELTARAVDGSIQREEYPRAVCQFVQKAMEALIAGTPPAPPKPVDTRPIWAREKPHERSPDFPKWKLLQGGRYSIEDIEEIQLAGGSHYFGQMLMVGHSKDWVLREVTEEKTRQAERNAAIKKRWPNR